MKKQSIIATAAVAAGLAFSVATAQEATTAPVGYKKETLSQGFNLIGITLHEPTLVSGTFDADQVDSTLTDTDVDFTSILTGSDLYILELANGQIAELTSASAASATTLTAAVTGVVSGDAYSIRKASTLASIFGESNEAGLQGTDAFNANSADLVFVPNGNGGFDRFYYSTNAGLQGWINVATFAPSGSSPIVYLDGVLVQKRSGSIDLTVTGEVKDTPSTLALTTGFNYVSPTFPVGTTLDASGLSSSLTGTDAFSTSSADLVFVPNGSGGYTRYYNSTNVGLQGWINADTFAASGDVELTSGIIIQRRGAAVNATVSPGF